MREIKFRAWNTRERKMYSPPECEADSLYQLMDPEIPHMQYTGLKDKNGREIYEGDLLKVPGDPANVAWNVRWNDDPSVAGWRGHCIQEGREFWNCITSPILEVIGNIYENPELVK